MKKGCGSHIVKAISRMFRTSTYYPKLNISRIGEGLKSDYGVTQGLRSSGSIFSFYMSDKPSACNTIQTNDFMDPYCLAQLADDALIYSENLTNLRTKFEAILKFSYIKYQVPNIGKAKYCHFSDTPTYDDLYIDENISIKSVTNEKEYRYLGMLLSPTKNITEILARNI